MKILQTVQKNFVALGIYSNQSRINGKSLRTCLIYSLGTISSALFLICKADSFQEYTDNLYITTALAVGLFCFTNIMFKMNKLFILIDNIEKLIDKKSEESKSKAIYEHANRQVENLSNIGYFIMTKVSPVCIILPKAIVSYFIYYSTDLENKSFELPLLYWFPFNWRNPIGYFVAVVFEYTTLALHFNFVACGISFGVGNFFIANSAIKDGTSDLNAINESAKLPQNPLQTLKQISEFIKNHSIFKRYINEFLDIYQPLFMIVYVWSLVTMCGVMLLVQMEKQGNGSLAIMLTTIFYGFYAFGIVLTLCELGQRITDAFDEINNVIKGFDWNSFSLETQKLLPIILMMVQQPVELHIFGSVSSLRKTFKKVVNNAYSYFTVIRHFLK